MTFYESCDSEITNIKRTFDAKQYLKCPFKEYLPVVFNLFSKYEIVGLYIRFLRNYDKKLLYSGIQFCAKIFPNFLPGTLEFYRIVNILNDQQMSLISTHSNLR